MFSKSKIGVLVFTVLSVSENALGRLRWMERDGNPVRLSARRFGQENPPVINELSQACPGQVCGVLAGAAITPLLAAQGECTQQDMADQIIDAAAQFDPETEANMIRLAIEYRQAEKNTPPDFTTNPPTPRNSVFCQKAPKNSQLIGLVQAQDPANEDLFFDPATKASVVRGSQANTFPFGDNNGGVDAPDEEEEVEEPVEDSEPTVTESAAPTATDGAAECPANLPTVTVTVTGTAQATASNAVTVSAPAATPTAPPAGDVGDIGDFGSCTVPEIEFGPGFDGRRETSFRPVDLVNFNHGSAQNIAIITRFVCDQLVNRCGADETAIATCAAAKATADAGTAKDGVQADLFNAAFGIITNFADDAVIDDQGRIVKEAVGGANGGDAADPDTGDEADPATGDEADPATGDDTDTGNENSGGIGDFGSCSVPEIEFGAGFDNRRETSFRPVDLVSYNHGSAQNIAIITQFICDQLVNKCGADATARATCAAAKATADAGTAKDGIQADLFNAGFGITTNFADVAIIDNQGNVVKAGAGADVDTGDDDAADDAEDDAADDAANGGNNGGNNTPAVAGNLQQFAGALGGVTAPAVTDIGGGQFQVAGNASFNNLESALVRSCDVHNNQCANAANASGNQNGFNVAACNAQQATCIAQARA